MDELDLFIDKICKGGDTSSNDIKTSTSDKSGVQILSEGTNIWTYESNSNNVLPKRRK